MVGGFSLFSLVPLAYITRHVNPKKGAGQDRLQRQRNQAENSSGSTSSALKYKEKKPLKFKNSIRSRPKRSYRWRFIKHASSRLTVIIGGFTLTAHRPYDFVRLPIC